MASTHRTTSVASLAQMPVGVPRLVRYRDPVEGFPGWVAFAGEGQMLAAGGLRVHEGLTEDSISRLAQVMRLKEQLLGLRVDGAKAGIAYDPRRPGKREALGRFLRFLRPYLLDRLSLGPDMGTSWDEIERVARDQGIPSVKMAIARAQGLDHCDFERRLHLLSTPVGPLTLGQRRAGHALAHAALTVLERTPPHGGRCPRVGIQGWGTLARGAALSLSEAGVAVVAVADEHACLYDLNGLDVRRLLALPAGVAVSGADASGAPPDRLLQTSLDLLVLAACENGVGRAQSASLRAGAVVVGANLGLSPQVEVELQRSGVLVVPDFVGGCGGSASMDALFGPASCPQPRDVLAGVAAKVRATVASMLDLTDIQGVSSREAAMTLCQRRARADSGRPYGEPDGRDLDMVGRDPQAAPGQQAPSR